MRSTYSHQVYRGGSIGRRALHLPAGVVIAGRLVLIGVVVGCLTAGGLAWSPEPGPGAQAAALSDVSSADSLKVASADVISVQQLTTPVLESAFNIALLSDDFIHMTISEMAAYYKTTFVPSQLPSGLIEAVGKGFRASERLGVYKRGGGTGEMYWDQNTLQWTDTGDAYQYHESLMVTVSGQGLPYRFLALADLTQRTQDSVINGTDVIIGEYVDGSAVALYAQFTYQGTGFEVDTINLSQSDLVSVISGLIQ